MASARLLAMGSVEEGTSKLASIVSSGSKRRARASQLGDIASKPPSRRRLDRPSSLMARLSEANMSGSRS